MAVKLFPITQDELRSFVEDAVNEYANDMIKAEEHSDFKKAYKLSQKATLPYFKHEGLVKQQLVLNILDSDAEDKKVGRIWISVLDGKTAWISYFVIQPEFRNQGFGKATLHAVEELLYPFGIRRMELNAFHDNSVARNLYAKIGYQVVRESNPTGNDKPTSRYLMAKELHKDETKPAK